MLTQGKDWIYASKLCMFRISKIEEWLRKQLMYNTLIRFFIESYIEIVTSSMIQFYQVTLIQ